MDLVKLSRGHNGIPTWNPTSIRNNMALPVGSYHTPLDTQLYSCRLRPKQQTKEHGMSLQV